MGCLRVWGLGAGFRVLKYIIVTEEAAMACTVASSYHPVKGRMVVQFGCFRGCDTCIHVGSSRLIDHSDSTGGSNKSTLSC